MKHIELCWECNGPHCCGRTSSSGSGTPWPLPVVFVVCQWFTVPFTPCFMFKGQNHWHWAASEQGLSSHWATGQGLLWCPFWRLHSFDEYETHAFNCTYLHSLLTFHYQGLRKQWSSIYICFLSNLSLIFAIKTCFFQIPAMNSAPQNEML